MVKSKTAKRHGIKNKFTRKHYNSNNGMLTTVWGPSAWHFLHTMSFNYPIHPSESDKKHYHHFILSLKHVLPCGKCRSNLRSNFKKLPLTMDHLENRNTFSKYIYDLHELINEMLNKKSNLTYNDVRERYENFRAHCRVPLTEKAKLEKAKEKGCTEPIFGEKSKCILHIVPEKKKCETFQMDTL